MLLDEGILFDGFASSSRPRIGYGGLAPPATAFEACGPPDSPKPSIAQIAETTLGERRLVVRRVRTLDRQGQLLPSWELFPFLTNRVDSLRSVEAEHRQHAVVELAIRELKDQALAHFPSGH